MPSTSAPAGSIVRVWLGPLRWGCRSRHGARVPVAEPAVLGPAPLPVPAPDRDGDGVSDAADSCPDVIGTVENAGCPVYEKVIVQPDKLVLKEKITFAWN